MSNSHTHISEAAEMTMSKRRIPFPARAIALAAGALLALPAHAQNPAFPTSEQLRELRSLGAPALSPDAKLIVLPITDSTKDGARAHLWLVSTDGRAPARQLTFSPEADKRGEHDPAWAPDGAAIFFLAKRGEHTQLFRLPMAGGEAEPFELKTKPLADDSKLPHALPPPPKDTPSKPAEPLTLDPTRFAVSPDGHWIALIAKDPETPGEKAQKEAKADAEWVDHDTHRERLYLLDTHSKQLTPTLAPPEVRNFAWSPDSHTLAVLSEAPGDAGDLHFANSVALLHPDDPTHPTPQPALPASTGSLVFSVEGASLLLAAQARQDAPPGYADLYQAALGTATLTDLTAATNMTPAPAPPIPLANGDVLTLAESGFDHPAVRIHPGSAQPTPATPPGTPSAITTLTTNRAQSGWALVASDATHPPALYFTASLTEPAHALPLPALAPANLLTVAPQPLHWRNTGLPMEGELYLPPQTTGKVPLIVEVHGGPTGNYSTHYDPWVLFLLGHGWAVLRTNPRGSTGYGAHFAAANHNDLGGADFGDIMAGLDLALKTHPELDANRLALIGYSYGGEMAGFAEGKTDRFRAIISGAPVIDQFSEYGTESSSLYDRWFYGYPWDHVVDVWRQSPLATVAHAHTPFLLLQGEGDTTDPLGQSQEMYRALRQRGVPVELVQYPRDNHGPLAQGIYGAPSPEPWHGLDARQHIIDFLTKAFAH